MNTDALHRFIDDFYEHEVIASLSRYIEIPAKSPAFDPDWKRNGHIDRAMAHVVDWVRAQGLERLAVEVHELPGKTPTLLLEYPGDIDTTVLLYGHLDKQPEFDGWAEGLGPWQAVRRDDRLFGRGGADDGYAVYSTIALIKALEAQALARPRIVALIECSEESGSPDLEAYLRVLADRLGKAGLVIALDAMCGNYDQLWVTTSLRGMLLGRLQVQVLEEGAHSGGAGGIVASSFRLMRQLLSRLEDEETGEIRPPFLQVRVPERRLEEARAAGAVLADDFSGMFAFSGAGGPMLDDPVELVLANTWRGSLEITGIDGVPPIAAAGNVLRPWTASRLALRLPPTTDADKAATELKTLLESAPPNGADVSLDIDVAAPGWHAPTTASALEASLQQASRSFFGAPAVAMGCGGSIPFMESLSRSMPEAQFVVTGVLGPRSNAHGPNEFLHLPTAKKLTAAMTMVVHQWAANEVTAVHNPVGPERQPESAS